MRTPLNAILGLTSLLKRRTKEDPKLSEMLGVIEQSGNKLHQLIESVLDIQKIQQGNFEILEVSFQPMQLLTTLADQYRQLAIEKEQTFTISLDSSIPDILNGDAKRLMQAISPILENSIKFTPKNGQIDFSAFFEEPLLICQIQDSGIGIAKENHDKIFGLSQLDGSATRKHEGAGLGLNLSYNIIKKMGGTITVHSELGQGATFLLEIPLKLPL